MNHSFNIEVAKEIGINCAVILENFEFWINKNRMNERNFHDGHFWTYNSVKALQGLFPYLSKKQIETSIHKLLELKLLIKGNYNQLSYDRTCWYSITEKGYKLLSKNIYQDIKCPETAEQPISPTGEMDLPERGNGFTGKGEPIPDINTDINKDINISNDIFIQKNFKNDNEVEEIEEEKPQKANKRNTFIPPTLDEVTEYCKERGNNIDPEEFIAHYTCRDWYIGKTNRRMKDWKSAVVVWEKNELRYKQNYKPQYGKQNKEPTGMDALKELADEWGVQLP